MAWMPWLYFQANAEIAAWARPWQQAIHAHLTRVEAVSIDVDAFVAPSAQLFAEPTRGIRVAGGASVAAEVFLHGPIEIGAHAWIAADVFVAPAGQADALGVNVRAT